MIIIFIFKYKLYKTGKLLVSNFFIFVNFFSTKHTIDWSRWINRLFFWFAFDDDDDDFIKH